MKKKRRILNSLWLYRKKRGLSQRDIAFLFNHKDQSSISGWEKNKCLPSLRNALRLSAILGCPVEILFLPVFNEIRAEVHSRWQDLEKRKT